MSVNDPQRSLLELERLRDELRECIERAREALTRTEELIAAAAARDESTDTRGKGKVSTPPPE